MRTADGVEVEERLLEILSRYGLAFMARAAISAARGRLGYAEGAVLDDEQLERMVEEVMMGFRTFCAPQDRKQLWIELAEFLG